MKNTFLVTATPENPLLKKYIAQYYFHSADANTSNQLFKYYPHTHKALTIYKNSFVHFDNDNKYNESIPDDTVDYFHCFGVGHKNGVVQIKPPFNKVGVVFKPLGFNHFINQPLIDVLGVFENGHFAYFELSMKETLDYLFDTTIIEEKVQALDHFFLSQYVELDEPKLKKAVELIGAAEEKIKVSSLTSQLQMSSRTLLRLFHKHMGLSTKDFITIAQFRKALAEYLASEQISFTELSYQLDYFDQAEFNKHFKKLTETIPKKFFDQITQTDKLLWTYLK